MWPSNTGVILEAAQQRGLSEACAIGHDALVEDTKAVQHRKCILVEAVSCLARRVELALLTGQQFIDDGLGRAKLTTCQVSKMQALLQQAHTAYDELVDSKVWCDMEVDWQTPE